MNAVWTELARLPGDLAPAFVLMLVLQLTVHFVLRRLQGAPRWGLLVLLAAGILALPWTAPDAQPATRCALAMMAFLNFSRFLEVGMLREPPSPSMHRSFLRFFFYATNAPDARWPETDAERRAGRLAGARRLGRGLLKMAIFFGGFVTLSSLWPALHDLLPLHLFWTVWAFYFFATGLFDIAAGGTMLFVGIDFDEMFHLPPLAASPRDFWSRRWNMAFRNIAHRLIFVPMDGRRRIVAAVLAVFAFSALVHEYLVIAALGTTRGDMALFFMAHGVVTLAYGKIFAARGRRPLMPQVPAVACHIVWMTASSFYFFRPLLQMFPVDQLRWF